MERLSVHVFMSDIPATGFGEEARKPALVDSTCILDESLKHTLDIEFEQAEIPTKLCQVAGLR